MSWFTRSKPDRWEREPGEIARRIESEDVRRRWLNRPFSVFPGTEALVFARSGRFVGRLSGDKINLDGPLAQWFDPASPTTLIIVDAGDLVLENIPVPGLYAAEGVAVDAELKITLRITGPEAFYANVMKDRDIYLTRDLLALLRPELYDALLAVVAQLTIDDLFSNPGLRSGVEIGFGGHLGDMLKRQGLALVAVNDVRFRADRMDRIRAGEGEAYLGRREVANEEAQAKVAGLRVELQQRIRETMAQDARHRALTEHELQDAIAQAIHEANLKQTLRADELQQLQATLRHDMADLMQSRTAQREADALNHTLNQDATQRGHDRTQSGLDLTAELTAEQRKAEAAALKRAIERAEDAAELDLANQARNKILEARAEKLRQDAEHERERAQTFNNVDTATKIALGAGNVDALLELERTAAEKGMSFEQILASAVRENPAAADVLARHLQATASEQHLREQLERERSHAERAESTNRENAARHERILMHSLSQMSQVATARADAQGPGNQTIITGSGGGGGGVGPFGVAPGAPIVIHTSGSSGGGGTVNTATSESDRQERKPQPKPVAEPPTDSKTE